MSFKCLVPVLWLQAKRDVHILHCLWLAHVLGFVMLRAGSREEAASQSGCSQSIIHRALPAKSFKGKVSCQSLTGMQTKK